MFYCTGLWQAMTAICLQTKGLLLMNRGTLTDREGAGGGGGQSYKYFTVVAGGVM